MLKAIKNLNAKAFFVPVLTVLTVQTVSLTAYTQQAIHPTEQNAHQQKDVTSARRQYLGNLGFNDIPQEIRKRLQAGQWKGEMNRRQMVTSAEAYEVVNAARELSLLMMKEIDARGVDEAKKKELARFAAKMLALKPESPPTNYPSEITEMKHGLARDEALVEWLAKQRAPQMTEQKARLLSDIASLIYDGNINGKEAALEHMDKMLTVIIDRMYHDDTIGNAKYLGRALSLLLVREDVVEQRAEIAKGNNWDKANSYYRMMGTELRSKYNLFLENFIGDSIRLPDPKQENGVLRKIVNGAQLLTRNLSKGSLQISWAVIPKNLIARWKARFKGLIGTPLASALYVENEDLEKGITLSMRIRDRLAQWGALREGLSHITYLQVLEDPETGIKVVRVIDNYPNMIADLTQEEVRTGGTRFTYLEQVVDMSHHSAVYIATPKAKELQQWSQENLAKNGYKAEFAPSTVLKLSGVTPVKSDQIETWKTRITEADFYALHSEKNPEKLTKNLMQRFVKGLEDTVYRGVTFHWIDPLNFLLVDMEACSQTGAMEFMATTGLPLEKNPSTWHWALRSAAFVGKVGKYLKTVNGFESVGEKLLKLPQVQKAMSMTEIYISAPNNLPMQDFMEGKMYYLGSKTFEQRAASPYEDQDSYREKDFELTREILKRVKTTVYDHTRFDPILNAGAAIRAIEFGVVMRASRGLKTVGFSEDRIAEKATEEGKKLVLKEMLEHQSKMCQGVFANKK